MARALGVLWRRDSFAWILLGLGAWVLLVRGVRKKESRNVGQEVLRPRLATSNFPDDAPDTPGHRIHRVQQPLGRLEWATDRRMSASTGSRALLHPRAGTPSPQRHGHQHRGTFSSVRPAVLAAARLLFIPLASAAPLLTRSIRPLEDDDDLPKDADDPGLWVYLSVAIFLVLLGGVFAGLTIALMGQDETYLHVISTSGEGSEKRHATRVLKLLKKGKHWVLVTLLLSNVITNETLPIVLDRSLGGGWPAVVSSTVLIGEHEHEHARLFRGPADVNAN